MIRNFGRMLVRFFLKTDPSSMGPQEPIVAPAPGRITDAFEGLAYSRPDNIACPRNPGPDTRLFGQEPPALGAQGVPPVGKRSGITGLEIADTLDAIFCYFQDTKKSDPHLLQAIEKEAGSWRGQVDSLRTANQLVVDNFFGQPAHRDIITLLETQGITREGSLEDVYEGEYLRAYSKQTKDPRAYWPGRVVPTLRDYRDILEFDAYRERLDGIEDGIAHKLLARMDAFEGASGGIHCSGTELKTCIDDHIAATPRHPSEIYVEPSDVRTDYLNAFAHTYSPNISWKPSDDMTQVTAVLRQGYGAQNKFASLAHETAKLKAAFNRGGIQAAVAVHLGITYGEDVIRVTMSMKDYRECYIPILRGQKDIDTSILGKAQRASFYPVEVYTGYEAGKAAFFDGKDLIVSFDKMGFSGITKTLEFLRNTGFVKEKTEGVPTSPGQKSDFVRISLDIQTLYQREVYKIGPVYYSNTDMFNKLNASLREIEAALNGRQSEGSLRAKSHPSVDDNFSFEHNGDMYIPSGEVYHQIALHMKYVYGVGYTWVIDDREAKVKAVGKNKLVIKISTLDLNAREAAMADLKQKLQLEANNSF